MFSTRKALSTLVVLKVLSLALGVPVGNVLLSSTDLLANGQDAQQLNAKFSTLSETDSCTGEYPSFQRSQGENN